MKNTGNYMDFLRTFSCVLGKSHDEDPTKVHKLSFPFGLPKAASCHLDEMKTNSSTSSYFSSCNLFCAGFIILSTAIAWWEEPNISFPRHRLKLVHLTPYVPQDTHRIPTPIFHPHQSLKSPKRAFYFRGALSLTPLLPKVMCYSNLP